MNVKIDDVNARSLSIYKVNLNRGPQGKTGVAGAQGKIGQRGPPGKCCELLDNRPVTYIQKGGTYCIYEDDDIIIIDSPDESVTLSTSNLPTLTVTEGYSNVHIRPKTIIVSHGKKKHYIRPSNSDIQIVLSNCADKYILIGVNGKWWIS